MTLVCPKLPLMRCRLLTAEDECGRDLRALSPADGRDRGLELSETRSDGKASEDAPEQSVVPR